VYFETAACFLVAVSCFNALQGNAAKLWWDLSLTITLLITENSPENLPVKKKLKIT